jgi:hypothetical protein
MSRRSAVKERLPLPQIDPLLAYRLKAQGSARAMRSEWVDPDDIKPTAARVARRIVGVRAFCPLRRMMPITGSGITDSHVMAADKLREAVDVAALGFTAGRAELVLVGLSASPQPRAGPSQAEIARAQAARVVERALKSFTDGQRAMINAVILRNLSLRAWVALRAEETGIRFDPNVEKGRLLAILDILAQHFETEIDDEVSRGSRLPP